MKGQAVNDITATVEALLEKEEQILARAVAQTTKRYHEDPSKQNLRNWEAAKEAMKKKQANKPPKPDAHELTLEKGYKKVKAAYDKKPTVGNQKALTNAKKDLDDYRAQRLAAADPSALRLKNRPEVLEYLKAKGWKIEKSKLYADWKKIDLEKDGSCTKAAADSYAKLCLEKLDGSDQEPVDMANKVLWETRATKAKALKLEHENEENKGLWILRSDIEPMLAARAAGLKNSVGPEFIHRSSEQIIELVDGNIARAPELIDWWLRAVEDLFDIYSRPVEFAVPAVAAEDKGA